MSSPASVLPGASPSATSSGAPYRIMVVDDSAVIRGLLIRSLESDAQIEVVASVSDGRMAVNALSRHDVEVVVLDIEMPVMDGLTALPQLIAARPGVKVIIASTLSRRNADISLQALAAGAADYIAKPGATALTTADAFKQELVAKIKALGEAKRKTAGIAQPAKRARPEAARRIPDSRPIALRAASLDPFEVLAIGSSTGGPQALFQLLTLCRARRLPHAGRAGTRRGEDHQAQQGAGGKFLPARRRPDVAQPGAGPRQASAYRRSHRHGA